MDYFGIRKEFEKKFREAGIAEMADIDWAMVEVLGVKRGMLAHYGEISKADADKIRRILNARLRRVPLAYILKKAEFFGREFYVNKHVLIPRQDTELLAETLIACIKRLMLKKKEISVLDLSTGSGILAITASLETGANVTASDISKLALKVAKKNAKRLGAKVRFVESDMFSGLGSLKFDIIVSNPPYIKTAEIDTLDAEVSRFEPRLALDGGQDGLKFYRIIADEAVNHFVGDGELLLEIGSTQAGQVEQILSKNYEDIVVKKDLAGLDRVVLAKICLRGFYD